MGGRLKLGYYAGEVGESTLYVQMHNFNPWQVVDFSLDIFLPKSSLGMLHIISTILHLLGILGLHHHAIKK